MKKIDVKNIVAQMIIDGDIKLQVKYDSYEHEFTFNIEVATTDEEYVIEQDVVRV